MSRGIITISETGAVTIPTAPVWMTQFEIADLFEVFSCDIRKAIRAIYKNKELSETDTMKYIKQTDGISYDVYNLEMVIAIAFRICSKETLLFRRFVIGEICATKKGSPVTQEEYNKIVETQLTELWSNYGKLFEIWFDGGVLSQQNGGADILTLIQRLQPNSIAFQGPYGYPNLIRWVGNEEGNSPYPCWATADATTSADGVQKIKGLYGNPHGNYWCPGEADFTLRRNDSFQGGWFWRANEDHLIFSTDELLLKYETSVGRNTNMLLGLVIDKNGLVPDADVKRAKEFGDIIRKTFSKPIRKISGKGYELSIRLNKETNISRIVLSEDIAFGERVLKYKLKGLCNGKWIQLSEGSCIGHKRIEHFPTHSLSVVKLEIEEAKDNPVIKSFAIY